MRIFEYLFMQRAFVVGILLAAVVPCVGMVVVCKRLSMIGDALSHTSLAGVAAGLLLGVNPVAGAAAACVAASFGIEAIRRKLFGNVDIHYHVSRNRSGGCAVRFCEKFGKL